VTLPPPPPDVREALRNARVYLIVTEAACRGPWEKAVERALASGVVGVVQLREKAIDDAEFVRRARRLRALANAANALVVLNDRAHLVVEADADGVHVGEHDAAPDAARRLVGPDRLVGVSTHDAAEVEAAAARGADYAGLGPCFATTTKTLERRPGGPALVAVGVACATLPLFPIGGISPENVASLAAVGATRVAVGAGVLGADDPEDAARRLHEALRPTLPPVPEVEAGVPVFGGRTPGMRYRPRPGTYAVILDGADRLAVMRTPKGVFLPGGGADPGETPEATLRREALEECGHALEPARRLAFAVERVADDQDQGGTGGVKKECTFFEARLGFRVAAPVEHDHELVWMPVRQAIAQLTHRSQAWAVAGYLRG